MEIKNLEEALKLQGDLAERLSRGMEALRGTEKRSAEDILAEEEPVLARARDALEEAVAERDAALRRWESRIARRKGILEALEQDYAGLKEGIKQAKKSVKQT